MAITVATDKGFEVQILTETVQGRLAQKNAFMGSLLASQGAVVVEDSFSVSDPNMIGQTVTVPYFGTLGDFVTNNDGSSVTPTKLQGTVETAAVGRKSLAFEVSRWARFSSQPDRDPYEEAADQIAVSATRAMDGAVITAADATPLVHDVYSATTPAFLDWGQIVEARAKWGDEQDAIVGAVIHSRTEADLRNLRDNEGRPLLIDSQRDGEVTRFCGIPLVVSDRAPLTGSSMGTVASSGTTPPTVSLAGTPGGAWNLWIDITTGGASDGTAKFRFSTNGGNTYSDILTVPAGGGAFVLTDTAKDSLVGNNGSTGVAQGVTGITATFANGTYNADNLYKSTALLKVSTLLIQRGALTFWYNRQALAIETDKDILAHTDVAAMHLYHVAHLYRRRRGSGRFPGVVAVKHNVRSYTGVNPS